MSFLVSEMVADIISKLNTVGQKVSDTSILSYLNDANEYFNTEYKMPTSQREQDFLAFPRVIENPLPSDWLGFMEPKKPYGQHSPDITFQTEREFVHWPYDRIMGVKWNRENAYFLFNETSGRISDVQTCDSLTEDGTWVASGDASGLALDQQIFFAGSGSLRFNVTYASGVAILTCTGITSLDLTDFLESGYLFLQLQGPSAMSGSLTSVTVHIGNDASNYWEASATTRYRGDSIGAGLGQVGVDLSQKTVGAGSPDGTAIQYVQVRLNGASSAVNGIWRLDDIFVALGSYYQLPYYSRNNVKDQDGTYKQKVDEDTDTMLCPVEFEGGYFYKTLALIAAGPKVRDEGMAQNFEDELVPKERNLGAKYPSQENKRQTIRYKRWRF